MCPHDVALCRYGAEDLHDANRWNNENGLAVLLDFDNFSGDEAVPDDIRRLSAWPNATRSQFMKTLFLVLSLWVFDIQHTFIHVNRACSNRHWIELLQVQGMDGAECSAVPAIFSRVD